MSTSRQVRHRFLRRQQRGVALMVALVMLVIIGVASVSVMRGALSSDLVANNTRTQSLAMQAAQIALRYCEDEVISAQSSGKPTKLHILKNTDKAWYSLETWNDEAQSNTVPSDYMESDNSTFVPENLPQCVVETSMLKGRPTFDITARGFSPDYSADADGNTATGSAVWLQSKLHF